MAWSLKTRLPRSGHLASTPIRFPGCSRNRTLLSHDLAIARLLGKQTPDGQRVNPYAYHRKTRVDFENQGQPRKWVTLRACRVLKATHANVYVAAESS